MQNEQTIKKSMKNDKNKRTWKNEQTQETHHEKPQKKIK